MMITEPLMAVGPRAEFVTKGRGAVTRSMLMVSAVRKGSQWSVFLTGSIRGPIAVMSKSRQGVSYRFTPHSGIADGKIHGFYGTQKACLEALAGKL